MQTLENIVRPGLSQAQIVEALKVTLGALPQASLEYKHEFPQPGIYRRTMTAPAHCLIVGDVHAIPAITKLVSGKIAVWDAENGGRVLEAPFQTFSPAGVQRVGLTLSAVVWEEIFETDETDPAKLEIILRARKEITQ